MKTFLNFVDISYKFDKKTKTINILSSMDASDLGNIMWYSPWRKYCLFPGTGIIFDSNCLTEIQNKITELMDERK